MNRVDAGTVDQALDTTADRAIRLLQFLTRAQQLKNPPPRLLDSYESVVWVGTVPAHPAVRVAGEAPDEGDAILTVERVAYLEPPSPAPALVVHLRGRRDDPYEPPQLVDAGEEWADPVVAAAYDDYLAGWLVWAGREREDRPVRELYGTLFSMWTATTGNPEQLEVVLGVGCLAWAPPGHPPVRRHMLSAALAIAFDDDTGRITVGPGEPPDTLTVELDMLDPGLTTSERIDDVRTAAQRLDVHPLHEAHIGALARRLVHSLDPGGRYSSSSTPPALADGAAAAFAPAVILRRRSTRGLVHIFAAIQRQIAESGQVPAGLMPLIDADHRPPVADQHAPGALVAVDDDAYLPMPVNDVQLRIVRHVDANAQTLVQGPPGTGKTHTAAALLAHLLAQGKRVLVTAHTDRALHEVRAKLPASIRPLSVAVLGTSREETSDLRASVERIVAVAADHDPDEVARTVAQCLAAIEGLRRTRAGLYRDLRAGREDELREYAHAGYRGTLAAIAERHDHESDGFRWIAPLVAVPPDTPAPLDDADIAEWHRYLLDPEFADDAEAARERLGDPDALPAPEQFAALLDRADAAPADAAAAHPAAVGLRRLPPDERRALSGRLRDLAAAADDLRRRARTWTAGALADVYRGRAAGWAGRADTLAELIRLAEPAVDWLDPRSDVRVSAGELSVLVDLAARVRPHLAATTIKVDVDGTPRISPLAPKPVRAAQPLFAAVRVDGRPPTTVERIDVFRAWADAMGTLAALDRAWPHGVGVGPGDTVHARLGAHRAEHAQLREVLDLGGRVEAESRRLTALGLAGPDWAEPDEMRRYADAADALDAEDAAAAARAPLRDLEAGLAAESRWTDSSPCLRDLRDAVRERDPEAYRSAYRRLGRLAEVRRLAARRDDLAAALSVVAPALRDAIEATATDPRWPVRLARFTDAWAWASTGSWLRARTSSDVNALQAEVIRTEELIRAQVDLLAATRAWAHAVSAERLTGRARADLTQYAQLVRALGRGTGKYADQRRADVRRALDRCRPSVPVWIMPIYRIAEQFHVAPDMFDVVIVDEASQAGLEATFLQYLAPRIVVIGDDRQVSPAAVGVDQQQMRDLAAQYLPQEQHATWGNPMRSLFDEAKARYRGMLTLTEHRRCVPEIIGFSNRIAYEPDGIRLVPVRQYGADRLEPIKTVYLPGAVTRGVTAKVNQAEVDAIVDQIEKCSADPRYDGLTFGVISLLGPTQAKVIEHALLERVPTSEWQARQLRCGDANDFQGSERDVMFLSMVSAPEPGTRMTALTREQFVQRYNVAASRAKDQMWVFHSVTPAELPHPEDLRFALLDYCYGVTGRADAARAGALRATVPDDRRVAPFDSLFEQRVFNRLVERGYSVVPQFPAERYRIDLVVVGAKTRLAVECDGDAWHGPDAYERDLARQRDLERCGWTFFRIREAEFYIDRERVFQRLWETLTELDIHPSDGVRSTAPAEDVDHRAR